MVRVCRGELLGYRQTRVKACWGPQKKSNWGPLISASI